MCNVLFLDFLFKQKMGMHSYQYDYQIKLILIYFRSIKKVLSIFINRSCHEVLFSFKEKKRDAERQTKKQLVLHVFGLKLEVELRRRLKCQNVMGR